MKNLSKILIGAFILGIFFVGCKKDDDDAPKNQMTYNETEYDLSQGFLENYGTWDRSEAYNFGLVLLSSGFIVHEIDGEIDSLSGTGHGIVFDIYTSNPDKLEIGDYTYDSNSTENAGTFDYAGGVFNYSMLTEDGEEFEINGGKLKVVQNGDIYELNFDCTTEEGKPITGFYKGSIKYYDMRDSKKSSKQIGKGNYLN